MEERFLRNYYWGCVVCVCYFNFNFFFLRSLLSGGERRRMLRILKVEWNGRLDV